MLEASEEIDFIMRGGHHPDPEMNALEQYVVNLAYNRVMTSPQWEELGFRGAYNLSHLYHFYMSRDPRVLKCLYRLEPYPPYIEMEVTQSICPLKCIMCELTYWNEKPIKLSFDKFKYAMDQFPELKWAGNNALGDPFTNLDYSKMVKYLDDKHVCQEVYSTTTLLKEKDMKQYTDMNTFTFFKFSMDGATKETYEKIRVNGDFDNLIANIKALDSYKKDNNKHYPEIHFHYIIMKQNVHECLDFIDLIDSLGINCSNIMFSRLLHYFKEADHCFMEIPRALTNKLVAKGRKVGINVGFNADLPEMKPPASECNVLSMPYIFPDGTVISCCCMNEQNRRDWQRKTAMGNIFKTRMRDIWYGKKYNKLRKMLWACKPDKAHPVCKMCNIYDKNKESKIARY